MPRWTAHQPSQPGWHSKFNLNLFGSLDDMVYEASSAVGKNKITMAIVGKYICNLLIVNYKQ